MVTDSDGPSRKEVRAFWWGVCATLLVCSVPYLFGKINPIGFCFGIPAYAIWLYLMITHPIMTADIGDGSAIEADDGG